jgi:hypothetical protein
MGPSTYVLHVLYITNSRHYLVHEQVNTYVVSTYMYICTVRSVPHSKSGAVPMSSLLGVG